MFGCSCQSLSAFLPESQQGSAGVHEWATTASHSHSETPWRGESREPTTAWQLHWSLISFNGTATMIHTMWDTCTDTHTQKHTNTSSRLVRNDFWTLDKFAVAGSLYLPVIAFLCPLSALPSKMFRVSGSWRWLGKKQQNKLSASHGALPQVDSL